MPFCVSDQFRKEDEEMTAVGKFRVLYKDDLKSSLGLLRWGADLKGALLLMENRHQRGE